MLGGVGGGVSNDPAYPIRTALGGIAKPVFLAQGSESVAERVALARRGQSEHYWNNRERNRAGMITS
jgi:hypothetical protein